jgi:signal peptidase II
MACSLRQPCSYFRHRLFKPRSEPMNLASGEFFAHLSPWAGVLVLISDQLSKSLVLARRVTSPSQHSLRPRINVCLNRRTGIAGVPKQYAYLLLILVCGSVFAAIQMLPATSALSAQFYLSIALAGAIGNLIDLARRGAVVDFIDLRIWPIFNLADVCIVAGTGGLLWLTI